MTCVVGRPLKSKPSEAACSSFRPVGVEVGVGTDGDGELLLPTVTVVEVIAVGTRFPSRFPVNVNSSEVPSLMFAVIAANDNWLVRSSSESVAPVMFKPTVRNGKLPIMGVVVGSGEEPLGGEGRTVGSGEGLACKSSLLPAT